MNLKKPPTIQPPPQNFIAYAQFFPLVVLIIVEVKEHPVQSPKLKIDRQMNTNIDKKPDAHRGLSEFWKIT